VNIVETIRESLTRHSLIPAGKKLVAGVSGGADSVALLHALHQLELPLTVAHLNHQLRGKASDADEQFVHDLARELKLPIVSKSVDVQALADAGNASLEMAARQARHDFFSEFDDSVIALAHHADDQVETFLLKLARGAGPDGLGGMPFFQTLNGLPLVRPMLEIPRAEIIHWMETNEYAWREDVSNQDATFLRNRVRHKILPLLKQELNPNIREPILRTMNILREENVWIEKLLAETKTENLSSLPTAARRRVLRKWLFEHGAEGVDFDAVEKILSLVAAGHGTTCFELNSRQRVIIEYGNIRFEETGTQTPQTQWNLNVETGTGWKTDPGNGAGRLPAEASFDAEKIGDSPIEIRCVQAGDRMNPIGMDGSRKLQDILTDQKIPRAHRPTVPVVVCRGEIIWIPGYRTARGWEVQAVHGKSVHVRVERNRTD
jgi:tRNA(Ile)-lysidine synthase